MSNRSSREHLLDSIKKKLDVDEEQISDETISNLSYQKDLERNQSFANYGKAFFEARLKEAGLDHKTFEELKLRDAELSSETYRQQQALADRVAKTTKNRQQQAREMLAHERPLLKKLSGNSPFLGWVCEANRIRTRLLSSTADYYPPSRGSMPPTCADEFTVLGDPWERRGPLDNAVGMGYRIESANHFGVQASVTPFLLPCGFGQSQIATFSWEADRYGILEAQGFIQLNGSYFIDTRFGSCERYANVTMDVELRVDATPPLIARSSSPKYTILRQEKHSDGWWWPGRSRYGTICREIELEAPYVLIRPGVVVVFQLVLNFHMGVMGGAKPKLISFQVIAKLISQV